MQHVLQRMNQANDIAVVCLILPDHQAIDYSPFAPLPLIGHDL